MPGRARGLLSASLAAWLCAPAAPQCFGGAVSPGASHPARPRAAAAASQSPTQRLGPGRTFKKQVAGGESHRYEVELDKGQYLRIGIEAQGGAVTVALYDPEGRVLAEAARGENVPVPEPVAAVSQLAGKYAVEVRGAGPAGYELSVEELRPAREHDEERVAGERASARAASLQIAKGDAASLRAALVLYGEALAAWRAAGQRREEARTLASVGDVHVSLKEYRAASGEYREAADIFGSLGLFKEEAGVRENAGWLCYESLRDKACALPQLERAVSLYRRAGRRDGEARAGRIAGMVYAALGASPEERRKAFAYLDENVAYHRAAGDRYAEADELGNLMVAWKYYGKPRQAILFGKQAVNVYQSLRSGLKSAGLEADTQKTFLKSKEDTYRTLAELLIEEGRLPEAQQVLGMLKEEEFFGFTRGAGDPAGDPAGAAGAAASGKVSLTPAEAEWEREYARLSDSLATRGRQRGELIKKESRTAEEEGALERLDRELALAHQAFEKFLARLSSELGDTREAARVAELREAQGMMEDLRELGHGAVALYTLAGAEKYRVVLFTPDVERAYEYPIRRAELAQKVAAFREALQNPRKDPLPLARELYRILLGPVARDLAGVRAETLMWSLDGVLRYLPVAALHDGERYLVESYRNVIFTPASQPRLKDQPAASWKGLGLGVSKAQSGFTALPAVPEELRSIIRDGAESAGVLEGTVLVDEAFTEKSLRASLLRGYPVVHIASHFNFKPGDDGASFLLLGDGSHLSLAAINSTIRFSGVDLLTLSACNTATGDGGGDGREVEGFAVIAQRRGAKSVVASLWPVADESTRLLMKTFYEKRGAGGDVLKAEALRQAQLSLLRSPPGPDSASRAGGAAQGAPAASRGISELLASGPGSSRGKSFAHPFFWAPFIMIGNWK